MLDLQTYLDNAVAAQRKENLANSDQLTLGELILKLEAIAAKGYRSSYDGSEPTVFFDFEYLVPTDIDSWRGSYNELALSYDSVGAPNLSDFIKMLREAVGKTYQGYKGGDYTMSKYTPIWVANYGNAGNTAVVEVVDNDCQVILVTGYRQF